MLSELSKELQSRTEPAPRLTYLRRQRLWFCSAAQIVLAVTKRKLRRYVRRQALVSKRAFEPCPLLTLRREQDKEATVYIGNLDERVSDSLVWELMLQAGRIVNVHLPKDRVTQTHQGYGFVEFISEEDAEYAARIMNQVRLYGKPIRVNKASADKQKTVEVGAELFVGNLDPMVSEQTLYDTFGRFGSLISAPKVRLMIAALNCTLTRYTGRSR